MNFPGLQNEVFPHLSLCVNKCLMREASPYQPISSNFHSWLCVSLHCFILLLSTYHHVLHYMFISCHPPLGCKHHKECLPLLFTAMCRHVLGVQYIVVERKLKIVLTVSLPPTLRVSSSAACSPHPLTVFGTHRIYHVFSDIYSSGQIFTFAWACLSFLNIPNPTLMWVPTIEGEAWHHLFSKHLLPPMPQSHPNTLTSPTWAEYYFLSVPLALGTEFSFPVEHCSYLVVWKAAESVGYVWDLDLHC